MTDRPRMPPPARLRRWAAAVIAIPVLSTAGWAGLLRVTGNVHEIEPGVYRSGQLGADRLSAFVAGHGIKTVINLRGAHPGRPWYDAEAEAVRRAGADLVSLPLSASHEPDPATLAALVRDLEGARKPLLIHCEAGADRSGLAAALYERLVLGRPVDVAAGQLSFRYGHFPWLLSRTGAMDRAFARAVGTDSRGSGDRSGT